MFGRVLRLSIDSNLPTCHSTTSPQSNSSNVETWKDQIKKSLETSF